MLTLDANLQEITDLPSNNGSTVNDLVAEFPALESEIQRLDENWHIKTGPSSPIPQSLSQRRAEILDRLQRTLAGLQNGQRGKDIIIVTHQGVLTLLAPTANIPVGHWQTFHLVRDANGQLALQ
jgi:broad specificity phosphatase PhoE